MFLRRRVTISGFKGEYRFLSNFWQCVVLLDGVAYRSVEHAYQASKTLDEEWRTFVRKAGKPGTAKKRGRTSSLIRRGLLRRNWDRKKRKIMHQLVLDKFTRHEGLRNKLLDTGSALLVEANYWGDSYWGVCDGEGSNHLGKILMRVRHEVRQIDRFSKVWLLWR